MIKKTLLTNNGCGPCSVVKSKLAKLGLEVDTKNYSIEEDKEFFHKHNIKSVPRLIIEDGDTVKIIQGIDDIVEAVKNDS